MGEQTVREHNGYRPVNKTDGGKKRAKKSMRKSRRVDSRKFVHNEVLCPFDCPHIKKDKHE